jgi:hypothetical protein
VSPFDFAFACLVLTRAIADGDGAWRRAAKAAGRRLCDLNRMKKSPSARCLLGELLSILCNRHFAPATALLDRSARSAVRYRSQLSHHAASNSADFTLRLSSGRFHDASYKTSTASWEPLFDKKGKPLYPQLRAELDAIKALRPTGGLMLRRDGSGLPWSGKGEMLTQVERISKKSSWLRAFGRS